VGRESPRFRVGGRLGLRGRRGSWMGLEILLQPIFYRKYVILLRKYVGKWSISRKREIAHNVAVKGNFLEKGQRNFLPEKSEIFWKI